MKTVEETRLQRLALLVEEFGSYAELNKRMGKLATDSTLSQYANKALGSKTGKPKEMGSAMARKLESASGRPRGWMDQPVQAEPAASSGWPFKRVAISRLTALPPDELAYVEAKLDSEIQAAEDRLAASKSQSSEAA